MLAAAHFAKLQDFVAKAFARISRVAGKSPEGTGALAALILVAAFASAMSAVGGYLRPPAVEVSNPTASERQPERSEASPLIVQPPERLPDPRAAEQVGEPFIERFAGDTLHESRWFVSDGWSNGDWMENDWRRSQVGLTPQGLRLTLGPGHAGSDKPFASGEIRTHAEFRYGYFEVRMRVPRDPGLITGFFTYAPVEARNQPNEIDIEILGRATKQVELTIHENARATSKIVTLPFDSAEGFHSYGIEWRPGEVLWYADGALIHSEAGKRAANLTRPQQLILSLWASRQLDEWVGEFDPSGGPWALDIACAAYSPVYPGAPVCN